MKRYVLDQDFNHLNRHCAEQHNLLFWIFFVGHPQWGLMFVQVQDIKEGKSTSSAIHLFFQTKH